MKTLFNLTEKRYANYLAMDSKLEWVTALRSIIDRLERQINSHLKIDRILDEKLRDNFTNKDNVIYLNSFKQFKERVMTENQNANRPEFKPGNKPYLEFGNEILNNNIPWSEVLNEVYIKTGMTKSQLAARLESTINCLDSIVNGNDCPLTFKQGARLLAIHDSYKEK
jgi:hypothetical protein